MQKILFSIVITLGLSISSFSQVNSHAIGLRGGVNNNGNGGEISYQHGFGSTNRLELDLGWSGDNNKNHSHMTLSGIYHWVWNIESGFNWYAGVGAQLGSYNDKWNSNNDGLTLSLGGQLGIEYDFNDLGAPILLSLDVRPMWGFLGSTSGANYGGAFGIRYIF